MLTKPTVGSEVTHRAADDPTDDYLAAAYRLVASVKTSGGVDAISRQDVLVSCVSSFFSLESAINRLYYDACVAGDDVRRPLRPSIPQALTNFVIQAWPRLSIRDKYLLLPPLLDHTAFAFDPSAPPFSLFDEFIRFRNRLVHPKIVEHSYKVLVSEDSGGQSSSSWGGTVLEKTSGSPDSRSVFPLTGFATSFDSLTADDAEKAFEIALRMRLSLHLRVHAVPPLLILRTGGKYEVKVGTSIGSLITLRFGDLPGLESTSEVGA